ncbi:S8 family peptidase [Cohnella phaseoli]|uniref:Type VII secretion-associated serine protease mycosin n=1 Tax=Cohnella phaseoli TaxID=456490 RepID=A0A3D9IR15_9BACL|nr:S8 family peptidase [Cohnella phaseoli]RED64230.1 type VII secretion-associated serine protease mycosin [Cohnella phaseoli]
MRRYAWAGIAFGIAAVLLAIPLLPSFTHRGSRDSAPPPSALPPARAEASYKLQTMKNDMQATERLARAQVAKDFRVFLTQSRLGSPSNNQSELSAFLQKHPEIVYAEWKHRGGAAKAGKLKAGEIKEASSYLAQARAAVRKSRSFSSPVFQAKEKSYFAIGEHSEKNSIVAVVSAEVIQAVERHQRRNLRLIPYPPEGRYRIESVVPGTNAETTVRNGEDNGNASHFSIDEVVVKFRKPLTEKQLLQLRKELDLTVVKQTRSIYVFRSKKHDTGELKAYFKREWNPVFVEPHYLYLTNEVHARETTVKAAEDNAGEEALIPNDTLYSEYQWNLPEIATEAGWKLAKGNPDIVVAVLDTGVQADHPDLKGRIVKGVNIVDPSADPNDDVGHGTHVAGIIAAEVNNNEGVAGMTWYTKIMPVKVLDDTGAGSTYSVAEGIIWATDNGAHVINMSLGNYAQAEFLHDAIKYAHDKGVVLVAASGNDNTDRPGFPAAYPEVLAVAATDPDESRAEYSNYGDYIDVAAPGSSIPSTYPGSRYAALSGTSMASPHVAALVSLVRSANPDMSNEEVMELIRKTAKDLGPAGRDIEFGFGQIDVVAALQSAQGFEGSLQLFPSRVREKLERLNGLK